jgi:hypothetical protein
MQILAGDVGLVSTAVFALSKVQDLEKTDASSPKSCAAMI